MAVDLSPQHERFCREYIIDHNATRAYQRAYPGAAYAVANANGSRLLANASVVKRIGELEQARNARLEITADRVLQRLAMLAFSNIRDLYDEQGNLIPIHELDHDTAAAIQSVEQIARRGGSVLKVKLHDQRSALELLGKTAELKLFQDNINVSGRFSEYSDEELEEMALRKAQELLKGGSL